MKKIFSLIILMPSLVFSQQTPSIYFQHFQPLDQKTVHNPWDKIAAELATASNYFIFGERADTFSTQNSAWSSSDSTQWLYGKDSTLTALVHLVNDVDSGWINYVATYYYYDGRKNDTATLLQFWDNDLKTWDKESKIINTYDANNSIATSTYQIWDSAQYKNSALFLYQYNSGNKVTKLTSLNWIDSTQQWDSSQQFIYTYDSNDQIINETDYVFYGNVPSPTNQYITYYNSLKLDTAVVSQLWTGTKWADNYRDSSAYNTDSEKILAERLGYNSRDKEFEYTQSKIESQYSADKQLTMQKIYEGDGNTSFFPLSETAYSYDVNGNNSYILSQIYNSSSQTFVNFEQDFLYYTQVISGINTVLVSNPLLVTLFPNPSGGILNLGMRISQPTTFELQVLNFQGSVLADTKKQLRQGMSSVQLDLSDLSAGMYFIRIVNSLTQEEIHSLLSFDNILIKNIIT